MTASEPRSASPRRRRFERGGDEFTRVLAFSDALFAIAMTLLVVGIEVPDLGDTEDIGDLADALYDDLGSFISFFVSFLVIGRYWFAHHSACSRLAAVDGGWIGLNLIYLLFVAFLPFPTGLLGNYFDNPLSIVVYAPTVAAVSGMEVALFRHAKRNGLFERPIPHDIYRWGVSVSLSPVIFFCLSIPLAFVNTGIAVASWFLAIPYQAIEERRKPPHADDYL
jgi:uncharacterized membrane protein